MKKIVSLVLVACFAVIALTACAGKSFTGVKDYGGTVSSNGGFAVQKGEYVYFINGLEDSTAENTFGSVVKGALVRAKLADIKNFGTMPASEVVVPKLFYTDYKDEGTGFYIYGDYVYYVTPSAAKDKTGTVLNTVAEFTRTKLDGTGTKVMASCEGLSTPYRFVEKDGKVYVTVYTSMNDENGNSANYLVTYDENGKQVNKSAAVNAYIFSSDATAEYAFYEKKAHNEERDEDESFSEVYRYSMVEAKDEKVLLGAGKYTDKENGIGTQGVTFNLIKMTSDALYLSETYVDTSVSTITRYYGVKLSDLTTDTTASYSKFVLLNNGTTEASSIFAATSVYRDFEHIIYKDATYGIVNYNYRNKDDIKTFGIETLFYDADLASYTYYFADDEYMYFYGNEYYYRVSIADCIAKTAAVEQITYTHTSGTSDFFRFEVIDGALLIANTHDPFYGYVCAYDVDALNDLTPAEGKTYEETVTDFINAFDEATREKVTARTNYRIGVISDADKEALAKYMDSNYPETSNSSAS